MSDRVETEVLEKIDEGRRAALRKLIAGTAYAVPVVASFAMGGLALTDVAQAASNESVPTLSEWATTGLGLALGTAGVLAVKKMTESESNT